MAKEFLLLLLYAKAYFTLMDELEGFCIRHNIPLISLQDEVWNSKAGEYFQPDGLHFTKAGNFLLASMVSEFLLKHREMAAPGFHHPSASAG